MDKSLSSSPPPSPHTDSSASPPRIENPEAEQPAYGRVAELERILLQQQREVERLQLAAKEKLAEAAQQLGAAKQALEEAKIMLIGRLTSSPRNVSVAESLNTESYGPPRGKLREC